MISVTRHSPGKIIALLSLLLIDLLFPLAVMAADYDATLAWTRKVSLSTFVTGVIATVNVKSGDEVMKGDLLVGLDDTVLKANLEKAIANVTKQQRLHDEAERELERNNELYELTVLSEHELEIANIDYVKSVAMLKTALAEQAKAQSNYNNSQIKAPFNGIILSRQVEIGQSIVSKQQTQQMVVLAESGTMAANVALPIKVIKKLELGQILTVSVSGSRYKGKIESMGFEPVEANNSRYNVNIVFSLKNKMLRAGQKASVHIP